MKKLLENPDPKRLGLVAAVVILLVLGAWAAFGGLFGGKSTSEILVLYGNVDIREADLAFNVSGRIEKMLVEEGDQVEPGRLLATLDDATYRASVTAAEAKLATQRATLQRLLAGSRPEEIAKARNDVKSIKAQLVAARLTLERTRKLLKNDFASRQKFDDQIALVGDLIARQAAAQDILDLAIKGPREEDIAAARAQVKAAKSELDLARQTLAFTQIKAKSSGTVMTRVVEPGEVVLANSPIYAIALDRPMWVRTYVSEPDLGRVHPGLKAEVISDSWPDKRFQGRVGFISPVAEFTPKSVETSQVRTSLVYRLRVYIDKPGPELKQGMPVTVHLHSGSVTKMEKLSTTDSEANSQQGAAK